MKISILLIAVTSLVSLGFISLTEPEALNPKVNLLLLQKKWEASHYEILGESIPLGEAEKDDYIDFKQDLTFISISEGILDKGKYKVIGSDILMTSKGEAGVLKLNIKTLTANTLVVTIDDPEDPDTKYFNIHFK